MSRRDTIIVAVLINTGLLALLFMMAVQTDEIPETQVMPTQSTAVQVQPESIEPVGQPIALTQTLSKDELDHVLRDYAVPVPQQIVEAPPSPQPVAVVKEESETKVIEVTVKRGDSLDKIARANNSTINAIMRENHLSGPRINIGQVLRVPIDSRKKKMSNPEKEVAQVTEQEYYVIKSGDNPWKIAKQYNVRFDELLKLNNLDEEKARNLKVGDRLRVR